MLKKIQKRPNELLTISDDNQAKTLLLELGMIDQFQTKVEGIESTNQTATGECKTHYILALYFTGKTVETDNGYVVYAVPKNKYSLEKMGEFYSQVMARIGGMSSNLVSVQQFNPYLPKTSN